jgi:hypothetical protein
LSGCLCAPQSRRRSHRRTTPEERAPTYFRPCTRRIRIHTILQILARVAQSEQIDANISL